MLRKVLPCLIAVAALFSTAMLSPSKAQNVRTDHTPIRPQIPLADRDDESRVFLEHAEKLVSKPYTDYQILVGDVKFRRGGMLMYCDSAHFYDQTGSFDAFGNVKMRQGDTLFIDGDELNYNDSLQLATIYAEFGKKVKLRNRDVTLITDIFNYDMELDLGYYDVGGELIDNQNRLTSLIGEYSPSTKDATFTDNVHLESLSSTDTLEIFTEHLVYNTNTHIAELNDYSRIISADGVIVTTNGVYNTESTDTELYQRSTVTANNGNTLTGDTLFYNRNTGIGRAYGNIELQDTTNKVIMYGDYGYYDELVDSAFVTGRARAVEYSQGDSLHLHGDTIRMFRVITLPVVPEVAAPVVAQLTAAGDTISGSAFLADSVPVSKESASPALIDSLSYLETRDSVVAPSATLESVVIPDSIVAVPDTVRYIVAAPHVKFYRKDMQGVCDSMTFVSRDTMIWMNYKPIVWSENRQITGSTIQIHLNDSTVDWAKVPANAFMAEFIEDGYYNQLSGKEMVAKFINGELHHLDVNGNVLAISFLEENDSTINKVTNIESSFLAADFKDNNIQKMKLWSQTNATVTPLYLAKKSLFFLAGFKWYDVYRPASPNDIYDFSDSLLDLFNDARREAGAPLVGFKPKENGLDELPAADAATETDKDNDEIDNSGSIDQPADDNRTSLLKSNTNADEKPTQQSVE